MESKSNRNETRTEKETKMMEHEYCVETTKDNRDTIIKELWLLGTVVNRWPDGSFNFACYDCECEDDLSDVLENLKVDYKLV